MRRALVILLVIALCVGAGYYLWLQSAPAPGSALGMEPKSFIECVERYPVQGDSPRTCTTGLGVTYTEDVGNALQMQDRITTSIEPNAVISSPLSVGGKARGSWFDAGGEFVVELLDTSGNLLSSGSAEARGAWGEDNYFTSFEATLTFAPPRIEKSGTLLLRPGSGTGEPLTVPVRFEQ